MTIFTPSLPPSFFFLSALTLLFLIVPFLPSFLPSLFLPYFFFPAGLSVLVQIIEGSCCHHSRSLYLVSLPLPPFVLHPGDWGFLVRGAAKDVGRTRTEIVLLDEFSRQVRNV